MAELMLIQTMAAMLGERTNITLYIVLGIVAVVLVILSVVLKMLTKKKK